MKYWEGTRMRTTSEETQQNWLKRFERKQAEGFFGHFISWFDFMKEKKELIIKDFAQTNDIWGRMGNKVYRLKNNGRYELYLKFKNATKAKRFMEGVK